ncbi:transmembrane protease serine 11D-like [Centruroides sculpturatus]|uniref:transmembrane protease serine 11D-like n=1 Tax=Centruroides sculpturatus TaxID=218467 RepID=UPI000C6E1F50|nr:transmembrane protease serine 11D-like [Centruroides sculpturatus]
MSSAFVLTFFSLLICVDLSAVQDEKRIFGGRFANPGEFPWMVFIRLTDELNCSGFLISPSYVLTAAHCMIRPLEEMWAKIGTVDREEGQEYRFRSSRVHPDYSNLTYHGDIALLKLTSPVVFDRNIDRICLANDRNYYRGNTPVLQMGWGRFSNETAEVTRILKVTEEGYIFDHGDCSDMFAFFNYTLWDGTVCIKNSGSEGVCEGDSGGPLVTRNGNSYTAIGLESIGFYENCTVDNSFAEVFTDLLYHRQWIVDNVDETICQQ